MVWFHTMGDKERFFFLFLPYKDSLIYLSNISGLVKI